MFINSEVNKLWERFCNMPRYTFMIRNNNEPYIERIKSINGNNINIKEVELIVKELLTVIVEKDKEISKLKRKLK